MTMIPNAVKAYCIELHTGRVMDWPPQSLKLNVIEAVWCHRGREWNKRQPTTNEELWMSFKKPGSIPEYYLKKLQESFSKRVQAMLKNKSDHSKYWLLSLLELYKLSFCPVYFISMYSHFTKIAEHKGTTQGFAQYLKS